jgi:hypothetical protein
MIKPAYSIILMDLTLSASNRTPFNTPPQTNTHSSVNKPNQQTTNGFSSEPLKVLTFTRLKEVFNSLQKSEHTGIQFPTDVASYLRRMKYSALNVFETCKRHILFFVFVSVSLPFSLQIC